MASKQSTLTQTKGVVSSPAQRTKPPGTTLPTPTPSHPNTGTQNHTPSQASPTAHMIQKAIEMLVERLDGMDKRLVERDTKMERRCVEAEQNMEKRYNDTKQMLQEQGREMERRCVEAEQKMEKRYNDIKQMLQEQGGGLERKWEEQRKAMAADMEQMKEAIQAHYKEIGEEMEKNLQEIREKVDKRMEKVENQVEGQRTEIAEMRGVTQDQATMIQYQQLATAIRFRGLKETPDETQGSLAGTFIEALAAFLGKPTSAIEWQIDRINRVGARTTTNRHQPRDVVIHFVTQGFRNRISATSYHKSLYIKGQEVKVLKEIPQTMLRDRKEYKFLVDELRSRAVRFRWETPTGMTFYYKNKRHQLNSVQQAREFLEKELMPEGSQYTTREDAEKPPDRQTDARTRERKGPTRDTTTQRTGNNNNNKGTRQIAEGRITRSTTKRTDQQDAIPICNSNTNSDTMGTRPKNTTGDRMKAVSEEYPETDNDD